MLFNSHVFLLAFLPITLTGFFFLCRFSSSLPPRVWMLAASLVFYGWWGWEYLALLLLMITFNFALGRAIQEARARLSPSRVIMLFGVGANLAVLAYFKYVTFFTGNLENLTGVDLVI